MAIASMVLGILALLIAVSGMGVASWIGALMGLLAIIFGAVSRKKDNPHRGMATAGLTMGIISLCWGILATVACIACFGFAGGFIEEVYNNSDSILEGLNELQEALDKFSI